VRAEPSDESNLRLTRFLAKDYPAGGDTALHDGEYDVVEWFTFQEALRRLSYANEAHVVEKAQLVLEGSEPN